MLAMMFSRFHGGTGTFRSASDFDFFRGVFFDKTCPALYDDGEIGGELIKKKKALSDVGNQETISKERWTAAKFVQHQLRIVLDNQYDPADEPPEVPLEDFISHSAFMKLVKPALDYIANADARAILKRAAFMVFTKNFIYYRFPTEKEVDVKRLKCPRGDLLKDSCKHIIANMKAGGPMPDDYEAQVAWESEWLREAFRKHDAPEPAAAPAPQSSTPMLDALLRADGAVPAPAGFKPITVKLESPGQRFHQLRSSSTFIDLSDTPPRASTAAASSQDAESLPPVGEAPDDSGGASYMNTGLIASLQNLGLPLSCPSHCPFSISFGNTLLLPLGVAAVQFDRPKVLARRQVHCA